MVCSFLAELEMKLHLTAEDTSLYLQDHSSRAVTRIPAATKELLRIKVGPYVILQSNLWQCTAGNVLLLKQMS